MADKKKKNPPVEAPVVEQPKKEEETTATTVVDIKATKGLSQSEKLQFATELRHRVSELKEDENPPLSLIQGYNMIRDVTFIDLAAGEIACGDSATGYIFSGNEIAYKALQNAAASLGVTLPEFKSLPAPSKSDLEKVGLSGVSNTKVLPASTIKVSTEAKKQKKAEKKLNDEAASGSKEYLTDHTKIETDEQLKEALGFQLVNNKIANPVDRLVTTAQFYRSYLEARAEKSDNAETELAKIHEFTLANLLQDISTMVPPTFITAGFGKMLCISAETSNCVVSAFNMFKRACYDKKLQKYRYSDEEIAAFVRVLIVWYASTKIADLGKDIKVLSKDAKANAKAIDGCNNSIQHFQGIIDIASNPSFDLINNLPEAYNTKEHADHKKAEMIVKSIIETYYKDQKIDEIAIPIVVLNAQQYAGVTLNLFRDPLAKCDDYSLEKLLEVPEAKEEEAPEEKKPAEEETKNA